ncbi:MAG: hypothetical protein OXU61_05650 [Gammaproteobacteria bacterium]|nr:hypothetical protein [Gammaproteobacteria bacterium]
MAAGGSGGRGPGVGGGRADRGAAVAPFVPPPPLCLPRFIHERLRLNGTPGLRNGPRRVRGGGPPPFCRGALALRSAFFV